MGDGNAVTDRRTTFDRLFRDDGDPWDLETSGYEREKRQATLDALPARRFASGLEIGCAFGVLTEQLVERCDRLLALDVSLVAIERARQRLARHPNVTLRVAELPRDWPAGRYDLIVLSEVLYFMSASEIEAVGRAAHASLEPGGVCLLVNWTGPNDLPVPGDRAADLLAGSARWHRRIQPIEAGTYRIDVLDVPRD